MISQDSITTHLDAAEQLSLDSDRASIKKHVNQAESALKLYRLEVRGQPPNEQVTNWLMDQTERLENLKASIGLGGGNPNNAATKRMQTMDQSKRDLGEMEDTGNFILEHLSAQRETIQSSHNKVKQVDESLGVADSLMNKMKQWWRN